MESASSNLSARRVATEAPEVIELTSADSSSSSSAAKIGTKLADVNVSELEVSLEEDAEFEGTKSTPQDVVDMRRLGKRQQLVRHFRFFSITSFVSLALAAWEIGIFIVTPGLVDGGRSGLIWNLIWNFVGFGPVYLSMAEMASMAPIAGAQYHWVSEFAPKNCQRFLSYITGWTSTVSWQAGNAQGIFIVGSLIQTIILVNNPSYAFPSWQGTLLAIAAMTIAYCGNVYGAKALPYWQNPVFALHILGYFAYIVPIWVNAPKASHSEVWLDFQNEGGWSSVGLAVLVGQLSGMSTQGGLDAATHMSEEVAKASRNVPKAILTVYVINMCLVFPAFLTICYHIPDLKAALNDPTTYPAIYVLRQSMSVGWITVILTIILLLNVASNISFLAATMRDLFAFARDNGLPFSRWLSVVDPKRRVPVNACTFSCVLAVCLSMIYIGSPVAFYAITSLAEVALVQCYCLSIGCVLWRRIFLPETLPPATFSLGRWGIPVNCLAVFYSAWCFFWAFWPQALPVTAAGFNWASPIFTVVVLGAIVYFVFKGRLKYRGPVVEVEGRKQEFRRE